MNLCFMNTHKKTSENENRNWKLTRKTHYAIGNNNKKPQTLQLVANGKRCCTQWAGISNNHQQCICVYYSFIRFSHPHSHIYSFITHYTYNLRNWWLVSVSVPCTHKCYDLCDSLLLCKVILYCVSWQMSLLFCAVCVSFEFSTQSYTWCWNIYNIINDFQFINIIQYERMRWPTKRRIIKVIQLFSLFFFIFFCWTVDHLCYVFMNMNILI